MKQILLLGIFLFLIGCDLGTTTYEGPNNGAPIGGVGKPPAQPTSLNISGAPSGRWLSGSDPFSLFEFSWINPISDFNHAEVSMAMENIDESTAFTEYTDYVVSNEVNSHVFSNLELIECSIKYYPVVRSVGAKGAASWPTVLFDGLRYDDTPPSPVTLIDTSAADGLSIDTIDRAVTADWSESPGSDNCEISHYEMAIGNDASPTGILPFTKVPGGKEVTKYQAQDGKDGFSFSLEEDVSYYTILRVVDNAGHFLNSSSSNAWVVSTFIGIPPVNLPPPTNLKLSASWVSGINPPSPIFTWTNTSATDFNHAKVSLGIFDKNTGESTFLEAIRLPPGVETYTWENISLTECEDVYYPLANSVSNQGFSSPPQILFNGFRYDNTPPSSDLSIDVSAQDSSLTDDGDSITRSPTIKWIFSGTDNCGLLKYFEMAIGYDANENGTLETSELDNVLSLTKVPGGGEVKTFQAVDGFSFTDEDGVTHNFDFKLPLVVGIDYYTSMKMVDPARNKSDFVTSVGWRGGYFGPGDLDGLFAWVDAKDEEAVLRDINCETTQASPTVIGYNARIQNNADIPDSSRVACLKDKSGNNNHFQSRQNWNLRNNNDSYKFPIYVSDGFDGQPAIHFYGVTNDGLESGNPIGTGYIHLDLLKDNVDFETRTLFFVGDFSQIIGGSFTSIEQGYFFRGQKHYFQGREEGEGGVVRDIAFQRVLEANSVNFDFKLLNIIHEPDLNSPDTETSKKSIYFNVDQGNEIFTREDPSQGTSTYPGYILGARNKSGQNGVKDVFLSEFIFYNRVLSDEERIQIEGYLACKWNFRDKLPPDHLYSPSANPDLGCPFKID